MMPFILLLAAWLMADVSMASAAGFERLGPAVPKGSPKPPPTNAVADPQLKESPPVPAAKVAPLSPQPPAPLPPPAVATNPASGPAKPVAKSTLTPRGDVAIQSDGGFEYDGETGRVTYRQKVLVEDPANDPRTTIACEWLTTILPPPGGKIGEIIAMTNVVITIKDTKGLQIVKGARAVYNATNDTVLITGSPIVEMPSGILLGDERVIYNRATEKFEAPGKIRMIARPGSQAAVADLLRGTNAAKASPAATTNTPSPKP